MVQIDYMKCTVNKGETYRKLVPFRKELSLRRQRWRGRDFPVSLGRSVIEYLSNNGWRVVIIQCIGVVFWWGAGAFISWNWMAPWWISACWLPCWGNSFTRGCWKGSIVTRQRLLDKQRNVHINNLSLPNIWKGISITKERSATFDFNFDVH